MANIPLRAYLREIEGLIDSGQLEETVAHCRYILQTYPKYVDTYRLLGKVFLEAKQFSNAADILQRMLSAVPDDFVSHVGMSIIREDEGNLDGAIWHMERAFESQPSNKAIQDELRRLFGRRDGMEPPKIRLTRGALARMYAKGNLYEQAIAELRGALSEDPQRPDLLLLLAQMNYLAGNKVEAVETSSNILKKFPYCLIANRILALILPQTERAEDARIYRQRSFALDPYLSKSGMEVLTAEEVPDSALMIDVLERQAGQPIEGLTEQPAWAATLGIKLEGSVDEELPDWLSEDIVIPSYGGEQTAPFVEETSEQPEAVTAEELIPEWMEEAGWQPSTGETDQVEADAEVGESLAEGEIEKADIPDWLREIAGVEAVEEETTVESMPEDALPPWLSETPPGPTDSIISWLEEKETSEVTETEESSEAMAEVEIPEWLQDLKEEKDMGAEITPEVSAPSMDRLEELEGTEEEAEKEELPEWLEDLTQQEREATAESGKLAASTEAIIERVEELEVQPLEGLAEADEWASDIEPVGELELEEAGEEEPEAAEPFIQGEAPTEEIEIPDWLKNLDEGGTEEPLFDETLQDKSEIPEWLQELGDMSESEALGSESLQDLDQGAVFEPEESAATELYPEQAPAHEEAAELDQEEQDAALAWLESLAAKQGASEEELITRPEDRLETPPEWITEEELTGETKPETTLPEVGTSDETELPEWLQEVEEMKEEDFPTEPDEAVSEVPAWVRDLDTEDSEGIEPSFEEVAEKPELSDEDSGLAWLESLAAKQGVSEEELITQPEDRLTEPPAWVREEAETGIIQPGEAVPEAELEMEVPEGEGTETWIPASEEETGSIGEVTEAFPQEAEEIGFKVDLNTGSLSELEDIPGVGFVMAQSIIEYRDEHGYFDSVEDLREVPGIDDFTFETLIDRVKIEGTVESPGALEAELETELVEDQELIEAQSAVTVGEMEQAVEAYDQLIRQSDNLDQVISAILADISQDPDNILLWQALGDAYMRSDQFQKALEAYTKAEKLL